ncbi:MAG: hypothetical protein ACLTBU_06925 [Zhenhengia sp.]|uniref:hypothetical protein n=1 Tax=Zhenhengia sp. TaxID=2944208 RepID=UPI0039948F3D
MKIFAKEVWDVNVIQIQEDEVYVVELRWKKSGSSVRYFKVSDFRTKPKEVDYVLNEIGYFDVGMYGEVLKSIKELIVNDQIEQVEGRVSDYIECKNSRRMAEQVYQGIKEYVQNNQELFPLRSHNSYQEGKSKGVILDREKDLKEHKEKVLVINSEKFKDILKELFDETVVLHKNQILREWQKQDVLIKKRIGGYTAKIAYTDETKNEDRGYGYFLRFEASDINE